MTRSDRLRGAALLLATWPLWTAAPAWSDVAFTDLRARLEVVTHRDGSQTLSLLAGGPLGLGGVAAGRVTQTETDETIWIAGTEEVSGVEPTPFFPVGEGDVSGIDPTPFAPDGARVVSFEFDETGQFSGVQPTPFRVYVATPRGYLGWLSFENATASRGGFLLLRGLEIETGAGRVPVEDSPIGAVRAPVPALSVRSTAVLAALMLASAIVWIRAGRPSGAIHPGSVD
jgi:hypothetical protein